MTESSAHGSGSDARPSFRSDPLCASVGSVGCSRPSRRASAACGVVNAGTGARCGHKATRKGTIIAVSFVGTNHRCIIFQFSVSVSHDHCLPQSGSVAGKMQRACTVSYSFRLQLSCSIQIRFSLSQLSQPEPHTAQVTGQRSRCVATSVDSAHSGRLRDAGAQAPHRLIT